MSRGALGAERTGRLGGSGALRSSVTAWDAAAVVLALSLAYLVKAFASHAGARELDFLLGPTAALVSTLTGHVFSAESGAGYTSRELFVVIAPVCSGINFALVLFTALACTFVVRLPQPLAKLGWVLASALVAYAATISANALRITLALSLGPRVVATGLASPEGAHRAVGVGVYLGCLLALHALCAGLFGRRPGSVAVPLLAYLGVTLVPPLLRGATLHGQFAAHAVAVLGAVGTLWAVLCLRSRLGAWNQRACGHTAQGTVGSRGVPRGVVAARRGGERSLPGQGNAALVLPSVH